MIRHLLFTAAAVATLALSTTAQARDAAPAAVVLGDAAAAIAPNRYVWEEHEAAGRVSVVVSKTDQRAYVYRGETLVAVSAVSTGREGKETPAGVFTILQKKTMHRSNLYDDAPMPFMQRLTWDGVALHAGRNPGYAASHGCVRLPADFAKKLYAATELGAKVIVLDESVDGESFGGELASYVTPEQEDATAVAEANRIAASFASR